MPDALWRAAQAGMRRRKRARELEGLANARRSRCRFSRKLTDWCACVQAPLSGCTQGGDLMNANRAAAMARAAGTVHMSMRCRPAAHNPGMRTGASAAAWPHAARDCAHEQALPPGRTQPGTAHKRKRYRPAARGPRMCTCASVATRPHAAQDCACASVSAQPRTAQDCAKAQALPPSRAQPKTAQKRKRCRLATRGPRLRTRNRCRPAARSPGLRTRAIAAAQPHAA